MRDISIWAPAFASMPTHRKTYTLAALLGVSRVEAVGVLHCLWAWALANAPDGVIHAQSLELAGLIGLRACDLIKALEESGWVDRDAAGVVRLHEWSLYGGAHTRTRRGGAR